MDRRELLGWKGISAAGLFVASSNEAQAQAQEHEGHKHDEHLKILRERFSRGSTLIRATTSWPSVAALTATLPAASGRRYPPASIAAEPGGSTRQTANPVRSLTVPSADCRRSSSCTPGSSAVIVAASGLIVSTGVRERAVGAWAWMGFGSQRLRLLGWQGRDWPARRDQTQASPLAWNGSRIRPPRATPAKPASPIRRRRGIEGSPPAENRER